MQQTLATVNINMGWGPQNPVLLITRITNVSQLVSDFIASYQLPSTAYDVIMGAIETELAKVNIGVEGLGRVSLDGERKSVVRGRGGDNVGERGDKEEVPHRKEPVSWDQLKEKKVQPLINRIEFQKKVSSPAKEPKRHEPKQNKITLIRAKSPLLTKDRSPNQTKRTISPVQPQPHTHTQNSNKNRTPLRQRQTNQQKHRTKTNQQSTSQFQILSQIFEWLTRNQPKSIKVLNPEYVSFTGIKPEVLAILQDFFEAVEESQYLNMDKNYFVRRVRQLNLGKRLAIAYQ